MGAENRIEDMGEEGNRSLGKMLQDSVLYTVRPRSLAGFKSSDVFVNLASLAGVMN